MASSAQHMYQSPRTLILPYCMYAPNLKINIPNSFGALQVSRQQTPVSSRLLCLLEHWNLSTVQPDCCTMPELPAQAKLICSSVFSSEQFLLHHYSSIFLMNWQKFFKNCCSGIIIYHFGLLLVRKTPCCFLDIHMKTTQFTHTVFPPNSSKYCFCIWPIKALLEE